MERIGEFSFEATALESIDLSTLAITELARGVFVNCASLKSVILPATLKQLSEGNFYECASLVSVTSLAPEPPVAEPYSFDDAVKLSATLYVPDASLTAYQSADVWKDFYEVKGITASGITSPMLSSSVSTAGIYNLSGCRMQKASRGINLIRMNDGRTGKTLCR